LNSKINKPPLSVLPPSPIPLTITILLSKYGKLLQVPSKLVLSLLGCISKKPTSMSSPFDISDKS